MDVKVYDITRILARLLGLEVRQRGNNFVLCRDDEIILYVFSRVHLPRLGLYGYYAAHFIEIWENDLLSKGLNVIRSEDPCLEQVIKALAAVGEEIVRVGRLRGKYGGSARINISRDEAPTSYKRIHGLRRCKSESTPKSWWLFVEFLE